MKGERRPVSLGCPGRGAGWVYKQVGSGRRQPGAHHLTVREAIVQKIPEFYEIISQTGRGGQSDFIPLIQK